MSTSAPRTTVVALAGNPRAGSRTLRAAQHVAERIAAQVDGDVVATIDLAALAPEVLADEHPAVDEARARLAGADVAVIATPVYKASYTGLLKAFLDLYGPHGLAGVVVVPLVVSGDPAHALVGEVHLRPVLVELGAVVPTRSVTVTEAGLADLDGLVDAWWHRASTPLLRSLGRPDADLATSARDLVASAR